MVPFYMYLFQEPLWTPENMEDAEPYVYCVFSYTGIPIIKYKLDKRLKIIKWKNYNIIL